jgi:hypothetical protein
MATTAQSQSIQVANGLISCAQQAMVLYQTLSQLQQQWTDDSVAAIIAAMGTVATNADGSLGTADGTPNVAHPIDPSKYPAVTRAISSTQIGQIKTVLDGFVTYVNGSAVTTQSGARAILNAAIGG